jgi:hypothetical protein
MIHKLELKNFKRIKDETFLFDGFDLVVGANNSGKSTALQALAIWQYAVDMFRLNPRTGGVGTQVVLPNFTALPLPEFNLLWTDKVDRVSQESKKNERGSKLVYITIDINVFWRNANGKEMNFCVQLRYHSPQTIYAIPRDGWAYFKELAAAETLPRIVYVPPFSGLEPHEKWMDDGNVREQVGKAQPGSVLRNLLYRVIDREGVKLSDNEDWNEITERIKEWFGVELNAPIYQKGISTEIKVEFNPGNASRKPFDIIAGGSGFHQILTILAFLHGYPGLTCILFDEPDAHLHVNLQRKIINYFKRKGGVQFIIATHSEEFVKNVEIGEVISILSGKPNRVSNTKEVIAAMSDVDNMDVVRTKASPFILYLEGEDDERILSAWAATLGLTEIYHQFYPYVLGGGDKREMKARADYHFKALKQVVPDVKQCILLDRDSDELAIDPPSTQKVLNEWKRKNIDNYLLVSDAWKRAADGELDGRVSGLFLDPVRQAIDAFFRGQNLTLPPGTTWRRVEADIFKVVDGKQLLFERKDALFHILKKLPEIELKLNRSTVAVAMTSDEIHEDVHRFFANLVEIATT